MYRYCKLFGATPTEYEQRPYAEVTWLLEIDKTHESAVRDAEEKASGR